MRHFFGLALTTLLLTTAFTLSAQNRPFEFGLKAGLNRSSLALNNDLPSAKFGVNIGLTATANFSKNVFLQSGLSLSMKGAKIEGKAPIGFPGWALVAGKDAQLISNQLYLQAPVYLGYKLALTPGTKLVISAGPYVAYGLGGKTKLTGDIIYGDMIDHGTIEEQTFGSRGLQRLDLGIGTGIGVDFGQTVVGFTYEAGFRDIRPQSDTYFPFYVSSYKNRNASLFVEYKF